eukprot:1670650-Karenia_brevis.AAC.1
MATAMEAQEEVRALRKEVEELKQQQSGGSKQADVRKVVEDVVREKKVSFAEKRKKDEDKEGDDDEN